MDDVGLLSLTDRARVLSLRLEPGEEQSRCLNMINTLLDNPAWPDLKIGGWLEHITTICILRGVTSIDTERNFTRPIKHAYYSRIGADIPLTCDVMKK